MSTRRIAALAGIACAAAALAVAQSAAVAVAPGSAPMAAVGAVAIDATPEPVKEFAIRAFGERNKLVLLSGIGVTLLALAVVVGAASRRRLWIGGAALTVFGVAGALAAVSRPAADVWWAVPSLAGHAARRPRYASTDATRCWRSA